MNAIKLEREGGIARIVLGSGHRANMLTSGDWADLAEMCAGLADDDELRAVVVAGSGTSAFSAGSDMREWVMADPDDVDESFARMELAFSAIEGLPVPVIATVRGVAAGAGCQLACACDLRIIGARARIGMPVARWGILVPPSFAARIIALAGADMTRELLYTGRLLSGPEAVHARLATRCVPEADLTSATTELVTTIAAQPAAAVRAAKRSIAVALSPTRAAVAAAVQHPAADYDDLQRGLAAFLPPRP